MSAQSSAPGRDMPDRPGAVINVSHADTVASADAIAGQGQWRRIDTDAPASVKRKPARRSRPKIRVPVKPPKPKPKSALPPGSLVLSPQEVRALDNLLATLPAVEAWMKR